MAKINVSVNALLAVEIVRTLAQMDVDQIRDEGRCVEVLRGIKESAEQFAPSDPSDSEKETR